LLQKAKQAVPPDLLVPIPDPKKIWLAEQEEMRIQSQLQRQEQQEQEEDVTFVIDTIGDQSLQSKEGDYIVFPRVDSDISDDSSSLDSGDSELYNSDKDYSWFGRYRGK
jgi:hypothetical protein